MKQKGATLVEVGLALTAIVIAGLILIVPLQRFTTVLNQSLSIERFTHETFIGMKLHYHNFVSTNGGCYNVAPSTLTPSQLVASGLLEASYAEETFFLASTALLTFKSNNAVGKIDTMHIELSIPSGTSKFNRLPNLISRTATTLVFQKPIKFSQDHFITSNIASSFCKGT